MPNKKLRQKQLEKLTAGKPVERQHSEAMADVGNSCDVGSFFSILFAKSVLRKESW